MAGTTFDAPDAGGALDMRAHYGIAPRFDFETGDIVLSGAGRVDMADAATCWQQWCMKAVLTQRGAYRAYSAAYGADMRWALSQTRRDACGEAIMNAINDALRADPAGRTLSVSGFELKWAADSVDISFNVTGADGCRSSVSAEVKTAE